MYNLDKDKIIAQLKTLSTVLGTFCTDYKNLITLGAFNGKIEEQSMSQFHNLKNFNKTATLSKILKIVHVKISLLHKQSFQNTNPFETEHFTNIFTILKKYLKK